MACQVLAPWVIALAQQPSSRVAWDNGQRGRQLAWDVNGLAVLLNILPLVYGMRHLASGLVCILVLALQMLPDICAAYAILALATNDDSQAGDLLE
jgi:hypothetical protein